MSNGYKMFVLRGVWLKVGKPMPFEDYVKSKLMKKHMEDRKNGTGLFDKTQEENADVDAKANTKASGQAEMEIA